MSHGPFCMTQITNVPGFVIPPRGAIIRVAGGFSVASGLALPPGAAFYVSALESFDMILRTLGETDLTLGFPAGTHRFLVTERVDNVFFSSGNSGIRLWQEDLRIMNQARLPGAS